MSQVTSPIILDSTGQDIVAQLSAIASALGVQIIITGNTDTNLAGVLQGANGKVAVIPVDNAPTDNSTNLVSSGGVKSALDVKANQVDLTSIRATGTTNNTGAVISAGSYFYLNNVLYKATVQIDPNATFTPDTNCKQVADGGLNELNLSIDMAETYNYGTGFDMQRLGKLRIFSVNGQLQNAPTSVLPIDIPPINSRSVILYMASNYTNQRTLDVMINSAGNCVYSTTTSTDRMIGQLVYLVS